MCALRQMIIPEHHDYAESLAALLYIAKPAGSFHEFHYAAKSYAAALDTAPDLDPAA